MCDLSLVAKSLVELLFYILEASLAVRVVDA